MTLCSLMMNDGSATMVWRVDRGEDEDDEEGGDSDDDDVGDGDDESDGDEGKITKGLNFSRDRNRRSVLKTVYETVY